MLLLTRWTPIGNDTTKSAIYLDVPGVGEIRIVLVEAERGKAKIGIDAPDDVRIWRPDMKSGPKDRG